MNRFMDRSIRTKLMTMLLAASAIALLLASILFIVHERRSIEQNARSHISTMARVVSANAVAYLLFDDARTAGEELASLQSDPVVIRAEIRGAEGNLFAQYLRDIDDPLGVISVSEPIVAEGRRLGTVAIYMTTRQMHAALVHTTMIILAAALVALLISLLLSNWLQRWISVSIVALSEKMRYVTDEGDYAVRMEKRYNDELGQLAEGFNAMLEQIQKRDAELLAHREHLEERVEERTRELSRANQRLNAEIDEKALLSSALEQAGEAIVITDPDGVIIYANRSFSRFNGYNHSEAIGKPISILHSDRHNEAFYKKMWNALRLGGSWTGKVWNRRKNGEVYPAQLHISAVTDQDGVPSHYVGVYADIREYASLEEQLAQSQKMEAIGTLVGGIAHDFNNMLGSIGIYTQLAMNDVRNMPTTLERLQTVTGICQDAAAVIRQLLIFARKDVADMERLLLGSLIREGVRLGQISIPENIRFTCNYSEEPLVVDANATQIQQILLNLLNNARDAVEGVEEPEIKVSLSSYQASKRFAAAHGIDAGECFARLTVADNGCGIARENLEQIFQPFFTTKEPGKGSGLGLAMAYGAVQSHGGIITVESQLGKGAIFNVYLPLKEGLYTAYPLAMQEMKKGSGETILIADDDPMIREPLADFLKQLGYDVLIAPDGQQALQLFEKNPDRIALAVIDAVMPHMGGSAFARAIRRSRPKMPIIFGTGYDRGTIDPELAEDDNIAIIGKPFDLGHLSGKIRSMVSGREP